MLRELWPGVVRCRGSCSLCAAPGGGPTGLNGGAAAWAPHLGCRSSEGGFILEALRKMQSLCYVGVSRSSPAHCGTTAVLCLLRGCTGVGNHVLFSPMVALVLASEAKNPRWGPGFLQANAHLKNRFCSAVNCRTEQAPETRAPRLVSIGQCKEWAGLWRCPLLWHPRW